MLLYCHHDIQSCVLLISVKRQKTYHKDQFMKFFLEPILDTYAPVCKGAIISQLRVWPFPFAIIVAIGERSQNPGHLFTGAFNCTKICLKSLTYHNTHICHYLHQEVRFLDLFKYSIGYAYAMLSL
jgi:hypothetical protein